MSKAATSCTVVATINIDTPRMFGIILRGVLQELPAVRPPGVGTARCVISCTCDADASMCLLCASELHLARRDITHLTDDMKAFRSLEVCAIYTGRMAKGDTKLRSLCQFGHHSIIV